MRPCAVRATQSGTPDAHAHFVLRNHCSKDKCGISENSKRDKKSKLRRGSILVQRGVPVWFVASWGRKSMGWIGDRLGWIGLDWIGPSGPN